MTDEPLYLRVIQENDVLYVVDQHGRKVQRVRRLNVDSEFDDVTRVTIEFVNSDEEGRPHVNRPPRKVT